jgi:hypothetical protein
MIRLTGINMNIHHADEELYKKIVSSLRINNNDIKEFSIARKSLDARKKTDIKYNYTLDITLKSNSLENKVLKNNIKNSKISKYQKEEYKIPNSGNALLENRPVIVGFGPAGIFAALLLARAGYRPIVLERGEDVESRSKKVDEYWESGKLDEESNVSFGEGGAGTFSDGKLNTMVKDTHGRNTFVMKNFIKHGADDEILYVHNPHIGTDRLREVVVGIRKEIIKLGGEIRFCSKLTDIIVNENKLTNIKVINDTKEYTIDTKVLVLAIGHSARDTFEMLYKNKIPMKQKPFAVGLRVQHPQEMIDKSQYANEAKTLSPASYKLTAKSLTGRGVYSFCMCPGGYVVAASTEKEKMAVNGMSYHDRNSGVANSAIIVTVNTNDFPSSKPLAGLEFQRNLESKAFTLGKGNIPIQLFKDYKGKCLTKKFGEFEPKIKGKTCFAPLHELLPKELTDSIIEAMAEFDKKIKGFGRDDAIFAGVESRTSSPIQIPRDDNLECEIEGIYPCGEGAGYAGGITSAAMDGIKVAESIIKKYNVPS